MNPVNRRQNQANRHEAVVREVTVRVLKLVRLRRLYLLGLTITSHRIEGFSPAFHLILKK